MAIAEQVIYCENENFPKSFIIKNRKEFQRFIV